MDKRNDRSAAAFTVRQLSELFGKSEDTIRRWKNEGIGRGEDNIRLAAVENEDAFGRRTSRHLVFTAQAVRDFVRANPFLMDGAPRLREFMDSAEETPRVFALPEDLELARRSLLWQDDEDFIPELDLSAVAADCPEDPLARNFWETGSAADEEDPVARHRRRLREEAFGAEAADEWEDVPRRRVRPDDREKESNAAIMYMLGLLCQRERDCMLELKSAEEAASLFLRRRDFAEALCDSGDYITELARSRRTQLEQELEKIQENISSLHKLLR